MACCYPAIKRRHDVKWTNFSRRQIVRKLSDPGTPTHKNIVSRRLHEFENIARLKQEYLDAGRPVISIDTEKKELLGKFYRDGVTDAVDPTAVNDHDFPSDSDGKVIPHGIYDVRKNEASVHLNTRCDTSEFACESIKLWWKEQGRRDYKNANELLMLCDGGGSNSASSYLFKKDLQALSNRLNVRIRIALYPVYCSKYNPIEHRLFPHV